MTAHESGTCGLQHDNLCYVFTQSVSMMIQIIQKIFAEWRLLQDQNVAVKLVLPFRYFKHKMWENKKRSLLTMLMYSMFQFSLPPQGHVLSTSLHIASQIQLEGWRLLEKAWSFTCWPWPGLKTLGEGSSSKLSLLLLSSPTPDKYSPSFSFSPASHFSHQH